MLLKHKIFTVKNNHEFLYFTKRIIRNPSQHFQTNLRIQQPRPWRNSSYDSFRIFIYILYLEIARASHGIIYIRIRESIIDRRDELTQARELIGFERTRRRFQRNRNTSKAVHTSSANKKEEKGRLECKYYSGFLKCDSTRGSQTNDLLAARHPKRRRDVFRRWKAEIAHTTNFLFRFNSGYSVQPMCFFGVCVCVENFRRTLGAY